MGQVRKVGDTYYVEFYARGLLYSQIAGPDIVAAEALLKKIETTIAGGEALTIVRDIDLTAFVGQFLDYARTQYPSKTSERLNAALTHFSAFFKAHYPAETKLSKITPAVIESYKAYLVQANTTPKKANLTLLLLREILEYGIKTGFLNDNPTVHVRLLPMAAKKRPETARYRLAHAYLARDTGVWKVCTVLKFSDMARIMYYADLIPLSREDMYR